MACVILPAVPDVACRLDNTKLVWATQCVPAPDLDVNARRLVEIYAAPDSTLSDNKKWFLKNLLAIKFSTDLNVELRKIRERRQMEGPWHQS